MFYPRGNPDLGFLQDTTEGLQVGVLNQVGVQIKWEEDEAYHRTLIVTKLVSKRDP